MTTSAGSLEPAMRYRAGFQATKVVAVTAFAAACAVGAAWWGVDIAQTWGLREADGGVLKPLWQRAALGGGLALLGLAFVAGMIVYWRFYIVSLDVEDEGRTVRIGRLLPIPVLRVASDQVRIGSKVHTGDVGDLGVVFPQLSAVNAPWLSVYVSGWRWPLLLDLRGRFEGGGRHESAAGTPAAADARVTATRVKKRR